MSASEMNAVIRAIGQTGDLITKLFLEVKALGGGMEHLLRIANDADLRRRLAELIVAAPVAHLVNTDVLVLPEGYAEERHLRHGNVTLDPAKLQMRLEPEQSDGGYLVGHEMRKRLTGRPDVLGYCELQYLYTHQDLIPASWKEVYGVYGWNTIVRDSRRRLYVPCLRWFGGRWYLDFRYLVCVWDRGFPAGLLASE